jgi:hypothetical protein
MKKLIHIFVSLFLLFFYTELKAARVLGSETSWNCLGNDTFEITFTVYISCTGGGVAFIPVAPVVTSDSCANTYNVNVGTYYSWTAEDVTPLCETATKICSISGGNGTGTLNVPEGIEKNTFKYKVFLGGALANCCWYKINWEYCCRTSTITTGFDSTNLANSAWLNRCLGSCNNSPRFTNPPVLIKCAGQDVIYSQGAYDDENDSLSYAMIAPSGGSYIAPWKFNYPVNCIGGNNPNPNANPPTGFNLDPVTGEISFRPMQIQVSVAKLEVSEWRKINGIYAIIGKTERDMEFIIIQNCNNKIPTLTGPSTYEACSGQQICISIITNDQDLTDTTRLYYNNGIQMGAWTDNNGTVKHASGSFCWTPDYSDARTLPYSFSVSANDDHCPLPGNGAHHYAITVKRAPGNTRSFNKITCTLIEFKALPISSYFDGATYKWYVPQLIGTGSPATIFASIPVCQYQFTQGGTYLIKSSMFFNGCITTNFDTLVVDSDILLHISTAADTIICPGETVVLMADSASGYQWYDDTTAITGANSRIYVANKAGKYSIWKNNSTCFFKSNTITIYETGRLIISKPIPICIGDTVSYNVSGKSGATFQWYKDSLSISGATNGNLEVTQDGIYYCRITQTGCAVQSNADTATFLPLPVKPTITISNNTLRSSSAFSYQWYFGPLVINGAINISYNASKSGTYRVKVTANNGCSIFSDPVTFTVGIKINALNEKINISPNPFHDQLNLEIKDYDKPIIISLFDMQGKLILQQQSASTMHVVFNTVALSEGLYLLEISDGKNKATYKVVKQ